MARRRALALIMSGDVDITIVLIGRNVARFLHHCLASVNTADWPDNRLERIYVDSGSTDRSVEIVEGWPGWRVVSVNDSRPSVAKGRNLGISCASSPFVQFLDADMLLDREWLRIGMRVLQGDEHIAAVFGRTVERYPRKNLYHGMRNAVWSMHPLGDCSRMPGASLVRTAVVRRCGLHKTELRGFEDVELAQRLHLAGFRIIGMPDVMVQHDSDMGRFQQYWAASVRGGKANYDILQGTSGSERRRFWRELRRAALWPVALLAAITAGVTLRSPAPALLVGGGFALAMLREVLRGWRHGGALHCGFYWVAHWTLFKVPYVIGFCTAWWQDRVASRRTTVRVP